MNVTFIFDIHVKKYKGKLPPISCSPVKSQEGHGPDQSNRNRFFFSGKVCEKLL
jgi:hypothetical protein